VSQKGVSTHALEGVAIVGMAGRFPGAASVAEFWQNQLKGIESISQFRVEELQVTNAQELSRQPNYVRARGVVGDVDLFDAEFFGMLPREAEITDPQHRLLLECGWEALESAGYDPFTYPGSVGVFAGMSMSTYFLSRLCSTPGFIDKFTGGYQVDHYPQLIGNSPDFLATRISYKLNLHGPAFTMQCGCSTSLLTVCQACQSLLTYQADMALAGGASITLPQKRGYFYQEGGMGAVDGHVRTFDANAQGTVFGGGVALVLLKRLEDALRDGDQIHAVIRGFATNNDGSAKVAYTAPSVEGQSNVIVMAQESAGVDPSTIGYVEAHGTGTPLGDPIELSALNKAFRAKTAAKQFCAVGTVKPNIGHLDVAAGVTGLINAVHTVRDGKLAPTLHFQKSNPKFDLASSPFYVNTELRDWKPKGVPRRAGVSAFGVGGTNAHVVIEQAPEILSGPSARSAQLLLLSARSGSALEAVTENLRNHLREQPETNLADAAFTLQVGRRGFNHRRMLVAHDVPDALNALSSPDAKRLLTRSVLPGPSGVAFLFPGQGSQQLNMGYELYRTEDVFRAEVDRCAEILRPHLALDLRDALYPEGDATTERRDKVTQTLLAQPAIFTVEYALAKLWMSWGIEPRFMLGHSVGEFTAACLAGVFSLPDALGVIAARGRLMQGLPHGAMLSIRLSEQEIRPYLSRDLCLAAVNSPSLTVVAGPLEDIANLEAELTRKEVVHRRLHTSHAFHSAMMDPILEPFLAEIQKIALQPPKRPYLSGLTGKWITAEEATNPAYWARHFREPVRFSQCVSQLRQMEDCVLLEVGPGNVLSTLAKQHAPKLADQVIVSSLHDGSAQPSETVALQLALGWLWLGGVQPDWQKFHAGEKRLRVSLPTYPFERKRYWLEISENKQNPADVAEQQPALQASASTAFDGNAGLSVPEKSMTQHPAPQRPRKEIIGGILANIFEDLSGIDVAKTDASATFLDLGFDSLFLTQVTQAIQSKFNLKITFRQLLGDLSTLASLAEYVDARVPAGLFEEPVAVAHAADVKPANQPGIAGSFVVPADQAVLSSSSSSASGGALEQLMRNQLLAMNQLFAQQIAALQGSTPPSRSVASPGMPGAPAPLAEIPAPSAAGPRPTNPAEIKELKGYTPFKPLQKGVTGELSERQKRYIRDLVERYTQRTARSKAKTQEFRAVLADPRVVSGFRSEWKEIVYPIITDRSEGSHLWDIDGNEYVDILNGFGPIMLGHRPPFVERAIEQQLHQGFEIGPQTLLAGEVARLLCDMTGSERATFCNTGSEAVIAAMRVARTVTGRNKVVIFAGDYHGMFDEVLVKGVKKGGEPVAIPSAPGIPREKAANIVVLEYGTAETLDWIRQHASELAAVIVEPVQSRHPSLQPVEFLKELRQITAASDTCFVFDEVVTGFRVHPGGCQALFNIRADLVTYGKVLAGGMPIGVLAGKAKYMDALDGGMWQYGDESYPEVGVTFLAGTFVRHPLTMAACKAVLLYFKEQGAKLQEGLNERTANLIKRLNILLAENQVPTHIESFSSIFYFSFPPDYHFGALFYYSLRQKGVHVLEGFPCFLTTAHSDSDLERIVRAFEETIAEMQRGGVLPPPENKESKPGEKKTSDAELVYAAASSEAPLTESQLEILLAAQLGPEANCSFNESFSLHMRGKLNDSALRASLNALLARHDALRASFSADGDKQFFAPVLELELPLLDFSAMDPEARQNCLIDWIHKDAHQPFDLLNGPLVRASLVRLEPEHHILLFTSHHIICDGWSTNVLLDELSRFYNAAVSGHAVQLEPQLTFSEYARGQERHFQGQEGAENEAYWREQFAQLPPPLNLPTDHPRPPMKSFNGATYRKRIGTEAYKNIKRAGAQQKCTLFVTLLAGFQALLSRLSGQQDIVVGIPSAGQSLIEDRTLVGHCVNFNPLRADVSDRMTVKDLLQQTRKALLDAYDHQNYTYGRLVRNLSIPRDPSRLPLMEVQFNLEKVGTGLNFTGLIADVDPNPKSFVNFDLFLNVIESSDGLVLDLDYNTTLWDEATVARWMDSYEVLLNGFAKEASKPISHLAILTEAELRHVLYDVNQTASDFPADSCAHQLFEEQVARTPKAIALEFEDLSLTYEQLNAKANQLARHLARVGVQPGDLVGIYMERSAEMVVALLGIWKAGAAYIPLDPTFPRERLAFVFADSAVPILLTQAKLVQDLPVSDCRLVCVDRDAPAIEKESSTDQNIAADPSRVAYTIYTSGSTGDPKGVEVTHRNLANLLHSMAKEPGLGPSDTIVAVTTISFDISALEIYLPLIVGAKLVVASRLVASNGLQLLDLLIRTRATVVQATPITFRLLLEAGWAGSPRFKVYCGGEALSRELANRILETGVPLWNMYGPTETTIWSATSEVTQDSGSVTIGPPIANTQFYVLDSNLQPSPMGVAGELYIGGEGVARGYYKRPELTSERFLANPFSANTGARIYRTGDQVRRLKDGHFEFLGRLDGQIKLRGFRIELGEIETAISQHPAVKEAVVLVREDVPGDKRLVAYLTPNPGGTPAPSVFREFLLPRLPDYMIPAAFLTLPSLPLTPNGKVDRKALPAPDWANQKRTAQFVEAGTPEEKKMAEIWAEVLRLDKVGMEDNLFELGADSLHVFQIVARANKAGIAVKPRQILQFRTIAAVFEELAKAQGTTSEVPKLVPLPRSRFRLVRPAQ
jgi:amino acid adenylation domain-containing protein